MPSDPHPKFPQPEDALHAISTEGVEGSSNDLFDYFRERPHDLTAFLARLDFRQKTELLERALYDALQEENLANEKSIIHFRKRIAEGLSVTKGKVRLDSILDSAESRPTSVIPYLSQHPGKTRFLLGKLAQRHLGGESRILSEILLELIRHIPKKNGEDQG